MTCPAPASSHTEGETKPRIFIVEDDADLRESLSWMLTKEGLEVDVFDSASSFLDQYDPATAGCVVLDVRMPGMSGIELQERLKEKGCTIPIIFVSGHADVPMAVRAMQHGAIDVLEKPFNRSVLLERIQRALDLDEKTRKSAGIRGEVDRRLAQLTPREREVMLEVIQGKTAKMIAWKWGVSARTIEKHRERVIKKMEVDSTAELILLTARFGISAESTVSTENGQLPGTAAAEAPAG